MIILPRRIILEIAECCAASLEFKSLLNVALTSRTVHSALKKTLERKTVVRDVDEIVDLVEQCYSSGPAEKAGPTKFQEVRYVICDHEISLFRH
jgi:hypothetical protein